MTPRCYYCGEFLVEFETIQYLAQNAKTYPHLRTRDRTIPRRFGGADNPGNVVDCCRACNCSKRAFTIEQFREYLKGRHAKHRSSGFEVIDGEIFFFGEGGEYSVTRLFSAAAMRRWEREGRGRLPTHCARSAAAGCTLIFSRMSTSILASRILLPRNSSSRKYSSGDAPSRPRGPGQRGVGSLSISSLQVVLYPRCVAWH
jgi:hypothetical protein